MDNDVLCFLIKCRKGELQQQQNKKENVKFLHHKSIKDMILHYIQIITYPMQKLG